MSTHVTECIVCHEKCYCCNDEHALGIGGFDGHGGCDNYPPIEFCSAKCALELQERLNKNIARCREEFPNIFIESPTESKVEGGYDRDKVRQLENQIADEGNNRFVPRSAEPPQPSVQGRQDDEEDATFAAKFKVGYCVHSITQIGHA